MSTYTILDTGINNPVVSIAMVTYNHEKYIAQALDSILMQHTTFSYKIVVAEDCSTDNTRDILLDYQKKHPDKFKLILQNQNIGAIKNNRDLLSNLEGKYVAALEGDDFWIDPYKLQKQTDFLEANENYTVCGHSVKIWDENKKSFIGTYSTDKNKLTLLDAITGPPLHTSSIFFRRNIIDKIRMPNLPSGDEALWLAFLKHGIGGNIKENMSVYRLSRAGSWSTKSVKEKNTLTIKLQTWILFNYPKFIKKQIIKLSNIEISEVNVSELTIHELIVYKSFKFISICYAKLKMLC